MVVQKVKKDFSVSVEEKLAIAPLVTNDIWKQFCFSLIVSEMHCPLE